MLVYKVMDASACRWTKRPALELTLSISAATVIVNYELTLKLLRRSTYELPLVEPMCILCPFDTSKCKAQKVCLVKSGQTYEVWRLRIYLRVTVQLCRGIRHTLQGGLDVGL